MSNNNNNSKTVVNKASNRISSALSNLNPNSLFGNNNKSGSSNNNGNGGDSKKNIIMVLIVLVALYVIIKALSSASAASNDKNKYEPVLINAPINAYDKKLGTTPVSVPNPIVGLEFTYTCWIYVADWSYKFGEWKNILVKGKSDSSHGICPGLWLYPNTNSLHARVSTTADPNEGCDIQNIPLKKWVHVCYVLNNRSVDMYINGMLERSCVLKGIPQLNNADLHVCQDGGFYGQISRLQYLARAVSPSEVKKFYQEGPYGGLKYDVRFFDNGNVVSVNDYDSANNMQKYNNKYGNDN